MTKAAQKETPAKPKKPKLTMQQRHALALAGLDDAKRTAIVAHLKEYIATDMLYFFDDGSNAPLKAAQEKHWQPWILWSAKYLGVAIETTTALIAPVQSDAMVAGCAAYIEGADDDALLLLNALCSSLGSLLLAMAVLEGQCSPQAACDASLLEATVQAQRWGEDETLATKKKTLLSELKDLKNLIA